MKTEINIEVLIEKLQALDRIAEKREKDHTNENEKFMTKGNRQAYDIMINWLHVYSMQDSKKLPSTRTVISENPKKDEKK